jgi:hypothetical protein
MQHCVTAEDMQKGKMGGGGPRGQMPADCQVKDFSQSGNTAHYKMVCTGEHAMTTDNTITFREGGYSMDMTMDMASGGGRQGGPMHMKQHMESKYLGPCENMK